ncbi:FxsA family protein [Mangrovihabitans endophyticus]|nr:FxsA family protein [Mangrovihabitans endophyticus]
MRRGLALVPVVVLVLAVAEIATFVAAVHAVGAGWALLALAAFSVTGLMLLRREGVRGWHAFRDAAQDGRPPGDQVSHSLVGLLGALLLAAPGFLSGLAGLLLLVPPVRVLTRHGVRRAAERRVSSAVAGDLFGPRRVRVHQEDPPAPQAPTGDIVEGEIVR